MAGLKEEWRDYPLNKNYSVSSEGRVLGPRKLLKIISQKSPTGHVYLYIRYKKGMRTLAKMVAETFLPEPPAFNKNTVRFIDGNTLNCKASNLRWMNSEDYAALARK